MSRPHISTDNLKNMKIYKALYLGILALSATQATAQTDTRIESFPVSQVRLTDSPFKHAQEMDICYLLGLNPDRLLAPYRKEAGLTPKAPNYGNWENSGLDGHIGGHYLSALSYMYAATGNSEIKTRLDYMLDELQACQEAAGDGYLCGVPGGRTMWEEIARGDIRAGRFDLNGKWVPLYNIHKTFAGLRDAYLQTGSRQAKTMLIRLTDWWLGLVSQLNDDQIQEMLTSEHGGLNEIFADVAAITGDEKYLQLARRFSHQEILQPLLRHEDCLTGMHANTQIPKVIGFKRIADVGDDALWSEAPAYFWKSVVENRTISIGGNSVREHFNPTDDFSSMLHSEQGPETCNTYNMLRLTKMLYETSGNPHYIDYYERALYNHILSTVNPVQGGFVYFTPMRPGHYRVYSQPQTCFWCCVGSGLENHARYGEMIYGHSDDTLYVNLFIPSLLQWGKSEIEQQTVFPEAEETSFVIRRQKGRRSFTLRLRLPEWTNKKEVELSVNGTPQPVEVVDGYITLTRSWSQGDKARLRLPMHLQAVALPDGSANYSFLYGPVVLVAQMGKQEQTGLFADDSRGGHIAAGKRLPLQEMPVVVSEEATLLSHLEKVEGSPLTFKLHDVYPQRYEGMVLQPFYRLYECRYMIYWPLISETELLSRTQKLSADEARRSALDAITTDMVVCGEQQPESDHAVQARQSRTGDDEGRHWREANGWFSYRMKTREGAASRLHITYLPEFRRDARIEINGQEVGRLTDSHLSDTAVAEIEIPQTLRGEEVLTITISKGVQKVTPHIYEIRLTTR